MKYPNINSLVPKGEHFDESAITGEGAWMTTNHVASIENHLAAQATATQTATEALNKANTTVQELTGTVETLNTAATESTNKVNTLNARILELEGEVKTLGGQSSGGGTQLTVKEDEKPTEVVTSGKVSLNSPDHPLNQMAAKRVSASKK